MTMEKLQQIVAGISFGDFRPLISIEATIQKTSTYEKPAVLIGIDTVDAMSNDGEKIRLYECFAAPDRTDEEVAVWIKERCQDVFLHEMDEFFRFRGSMIVKPVHPVAEGVFDAVRQRKK